ncbi:hypothetical protein BGX28_003697 [Mortierella sp. GBA30]|nr:hypothetical protein BGX28_003697 [Mortierella sp. GBA30]
MTLVEPQLSEQCCSTPETKTVWKNLGEDKILPVKINGEPLKVYKTGPKDAKTGIIGAYDILGFHPTTCQFYDRLARSRGGFQVSIPHYFKPENLPGKVLPDFAAVMARIKEHGMYKESHVDEMILAAVEDLRADGCDSFVIYGQCWGAMIAVQAATDKRMPFLAAGGPHPSLLSEELVSKVRCPLILLPSKDDDDMVPLIESVNNKQFEVESFHHRFETMVHGWTGGRGDFNNPEQRQAIEGAIDMLSGFTEKVVNASKA